MPDLYLYSDPAHAELELTLDSGEWMVGDPCSANGRDDAHRFELSTSTPGQGVTVHYACDGYVPTTLRGILTLPPNGEAPYLRFDDLKMVQVSTVMPPGPEPPHYPTGTPEEIIHAVYDQGDHDLSTKEGCGTFTEACCDALHASNPWWGHIRKTGAQNQYNGHAVDALMLATGEGCGIYDIIHDSESPNASPSYNYKGDPDLTLWYYPA